MASPVIFRLEGKDAGAVRAFLRLTDAEKKAELAAKKVGRAAQRSKKHLKETADQGTGVDKALDGAAKSAKGLIAGFAGLSTVVGLWRSWADHAERVRNAQITVSDAGIQLLSESRAIAEQRGLKGTAGLFQAATDDYVAAQKGGIPIAIARETRHSSLSQIQAKEDATKLLIADELIKSLGKGAIEKDEAAALVELMMNLQVKATAEVKEALRVIQGSMLGSAEKGPGLFAKSIVKGGGELLSLGATLKEVAGLSAQGRTQAAGSMELGSQLAAQVTRIVKGEPEAHKIIRKQLGLRSLDDVLDLRPIERVDAFEQAVIRARKEKGQRGVEELLKLFAPRQRSQMIRFFSPAAIEGKRAALQRMETFSLKNLEAEQAAYQETVVAEAQRTENKIAYDQAKHIVENPPQFWQAQLTKLADDLKKRSEAAHTAPWLMDILKPEWTGQDAYDREALVQLQQLGLVSKEKLYGGGDWSRVLSQRLKEIGYNRPAPLLKKQQLDVGELRQLRKMLTLQIEDIKESYGRADQRAKLIKEKRRHIAELDELLNRQGGPGGLVPETGSPVTGQPAVLPAAPRGAGPGSPGIPSAPVPEAGPVAQAGTPVTYHYHHYGDQFYLGDRGDLTEPGRGAPDQGFFS